MSKANVTFSLDEIDDLIQCLTEDKMKNICQKYANKIEKNINSLIFLYGGNLINFQKSFNEQATLVDKQRNEMKILVYKNEDDELKCPKCGEKIKFNKEKINNIILAINNLNDTINGAKLIIQNIIDTSAVNVINLQLKNVNLILNTLNDDIKKIEEKFKNLLNMNFDAKNLNAYVINEELKSKSKDNYILAEINLNEDDINKEIRIINSYEEYFRKNSGNLIKDDTLKNEDAIKKCEIKINYELIPFNYFYKFNVKGKFIIKYSFKNNINNTTLLFGECELLSNINLSHFNSNKIIYMNLMFYQCSSLTIIDLSNVNTRNVNNII